MPRLSIIIPASGDSSDLEATLVAVLRNQPDESEVIVTLNQPYNDPYQLRGEVEFLQVGRRSRLVELINAGFAAARGEVIHVLASGATVDEGWTEPALRHFSQPQIALVAPLAVDHAGALVVTAGCNWSRGGSGSAVASGVPVAQIAHRSPDTRDSDWTGPELCAAFYRRSALAAVGTLDTTLPAELAAIDLGLRMRQAGRRSLLEPESRVKIENNVLARASAFSLGWHSERLFWRHVCRRGAVRQVVAHGFMLLSEAATAIVRPAAALRMAGRAAGVFDARQPRRTQLARENSLTPTMADAQRRVDGPHALGLPCVRGGPRASVSPSANEARS